MAEGAPDARELIHDLRSPLMVIDGFAALLARDDGSLSAEQRADYATRIRAASAEMRSLIDRAAAGGQPHP
jgi:signal transduction histidine kinase